MEWVPVNLGPIRWEPGKDGKSIVIFMGGKPAEQDSRLCVTGGNATGGEVKQ